MAIKNEFAAHPEDISVDSIIELISKIDDFSVAISAAKWAVKQLKLPKDGKIYSISGALSYVCIITIELLCNIII